MFNNKHPCLLLNMHKGDYIMHKATKRDLLSLIGKLSFAAKDVPSGRLFLRRLIELSNMVSKLHHHIHLNVEVREDIIWWNRFLP